MAGAREGVAEATGMSERRVGVVLAHADCVRRERQGERLDANALAAAIEARFVVCRARDRARLDAMAHYSECVCGRERRMAAYFGE